MSEYIQVSTTVGSKDDADRISNRLVADRLAACVQVVGPIESTYWWNDEVHTEEEWLCIVKGTTATYDELEETLLVIHPYDTPEVVATEISDGSEEYLQWIGEEVTGE